MIVSEKGKLLASTSTRGLVAVQTKLKTFLSTKSLLKKNYKHFLNGCKKLALCALLKAWENKKLLFYQEILMCIRPDVVKFL